MKPLLILTIISIMLVTACSSNTTKNTQYYLLNSPTLTKNKVETNEHSSFVTLKLMELPDYLKQPSLVLQLSDHQLHYSHFHMWAEPLQVSLAQSLIQDLNTADNNFHYLTESVPSETAVKTELVVKITAFHATHQSQALLAGSYWLQYNNVHKEGKKYPFKLTLTLDIDGYPHAVEQMRKTVVLLANEIVTNLNN